MNKILGQLMTMLREPEEKGGSPAGEASASSQKESKIDPGQDIYSKIPSSEDSQGGEGSGKESAGDEDFSDESEGEENLGGEEGEGEGEGEGEKNQQDKQSPKFLRIHPDDLKQVSSQGEKKPAELTPEQKRAIFNPVEITDELEAKLTSEDPKVRMQARLELHNATVKNAVSIAQVMIQREVKRFEAAVSPLIEGQQQQAVQQTRQRFYSANKDLVKYDVIVRDVTNNISPTNADGSEKTEGQIFKEIANASRKRLQELGITVSKPNANLGAEGDGKKGGVPPPNKHSPSGRSGGDTSVSKQKQNNPQADIYVGRINR